MAEDNKAAEKAEAPTAKAEAPKKEVILGEDGKPLSKNQLKKLAKNKGKAKKEKPKWGEGKKEKKAKKTPPPAPVFVNKTPKGEKKDLASIPMQDAYHPDAVEAAWQDWWEAAGFYKGDPQAAMNKPDDEKFVMVIPPPNVTGSLHLGHALTAAVEDTLTRWHRMMGHATLYVPGTFTSCFHSTNACFSGQQSMWPGHRSIVHCLAIDPCKSILLNPIAQGQLSTFFH